MILRGPRALARRALASRRSLVTDSLLRLHESVALALNATARTLGVPHRLRVESGGFDGAPAVFGTRPRSHAAVAAAPRLSSALRYMTQAEIELYAEELLRQNRLEALPAHFRPIERFVYSHCIKILLCLMHDALDALPRGRVLGLRLALRQRPRANSICSAR